MDNEMKNKIDEIIEKIPESVLQDIDVMSYGYILTKAYSLIQDGPEDYRKKDAFGEPSSELSEDSIRALVDLCFQMIFGKGITQENPILINAVTDTYNFIRFLHFELEKRKSNYSSDGVVDCITIKHGITSNESNKMSITLYFKKNKN